MTNFITYLNVPISMIPEMSICQEILLSRPSVNVFHNIMDAIDTQTVFKVVKYCKIILKSFKVIFRNI